MARWRWQAALCNAVSPLDQSTETSSETHHTNVHLRSMRCRAQTEKDAAFLRGSLSTSFDSVGKPATRK